MKLFQILVIVFLLGNLVAFSQVCEYSASVEVTLQDENENPVKNATIKFENIPPSHPLEGRPFLERLEPYRSTYEAYYCESKVDRKDKNERFTRQYDVSINAKGYREVKAKVSIYHCMGSCLVNRNTLTIVSESAKLVTIKGSVKVTNFEGYNEKGQPKWSEKAAARAPISFKKGTMVYFFTTSDADGNYKITVPAGTYRVYGATAAACSACPEYFGSVIANEDSTALNIVLQFHGEG